METTKRTRSRDYVVQAVLSPETAAKLEQLLTHRRSLRGGRGPFYSVTQLIRDLIIDEAEKSLPKKNKNSFGI